VGNQEVRADGLWSSCSTPGTWTVEQLLHTWILDCGAAAPHLDLGLWSSCSTLGSRGAVDGFMFSAKGSPERYAVASALHFYKV